MLPGGAAPLTGDGGYAEVGELFFDLAKEANDAGDTFPIWGTCNGFELLTVLSSKGQPRLTDCYSHDQAVPLNFLTGWKDSNVFSSVRLRHSIHIYTNRCTSGSCRCYQRNN